MSSEVDADHIYFPWDQNENGNYKKYLANIWATAAVIDKKTGRDMFYTFRKKFVMHNKITEIYQQNLTFFLLFKNWIRLSQNKNPVHIFQWFMFKQTKPVIGKT